MKMRETSRAVDKKLLVNNVPKKDPETINRLLPEIKSKFVDTMVKEHGTEYDRAVEISEPFMQVILDASNYGFSINHSDAYSALGYACAWLRYYYPIEFITASLNVNIGKEEKTNKLIEYAKSLGIEIKPIKFRYSRAGYMFDKETNSIYQGVEPIKYLNSNVAEGLYELRNNKYDSFTDLLIDIKEGIKTFDVGKIVEKTTVFEDEETGEVVEKTYHEIDFDNPVMKDVDYKDLLKKGVSKEDMKFLAKMEKMGAIKYHGKPVNINSRQMTILISLGYFNEFGNNKKLLNVYEVFDKLYNTKHKLKTKTERYAKVLQFEKECPNDSLSLVEQSESELTYLGHIEVIDEKMPKNILMITEVNVHRSYTRARAYQFATGETREFKIGSKTYAQVPFEERDIIQIVNADVKPKNVKINGVWQPHPTEKETWLKEIKFIRKGVNDE
jgi:DNA polymerase III subunit alpha